MIERGREYVLWDGDCGFCRRAREYGRTIDSRGFTFLPYQSVTNEELLKFGIDHHRCARELKIVTETGRVFGGAFAINYFLWHQPQLRAIVALSMIFPAVFLIEVIAYKLVADNRQLFSKILFRKEHP